MYLGVTSDPHRITQSTQPAGLAPSSMPDAVVALPATRAESPVRTNHRSNEHGRRTSDWLSR